MRHLIEGGAYSKAARIRGLKVSKKLPWRIFGLNEFAWDWSRKLDKNVDI